MPFDMHSTANLPPKAILKNSIFFEKAHLFFQTNPNFERFEKSYYFNRILLLICYNLA